MRDILIRDRAQKRKKERQNLFLTKTCCIFYHVFCKKKKPTHGRNREYLTRCFGLQNRAKADGWKNKSCNRWTHISHGWHKQGHSTWLKLSQNAQPLLHSYIALSDSIELQLYSQETGQSLIRLIPMSHSKQALGWGLQTKNIIQNSAD